MLGWTVAAVVAAPGETQAADPRPPAAPGWQGTTGENEPEDLEQFRAVLTTGEPNPSIARDAVRKLLAGGDVDFLRKLLNDSTQVPVRLVVIEEFSLDSDQSLAIVPEILTILAAAHEALAAAAKDYLETVSSREGPAGELGGQLADALKGEDQPLATCVGAARAAGILRHLDLVDALLQRWAGTEDDALVSAIVNALGQITYQDFGRDRAAWSDWRSKNADRDREDLIEEQLRRMRAEAERYRSLLIDTTRELLDKATAEECVRRLRHELLPVRRRAVTRLVEKLSPTNGERDPTLPLVVEPVRARLREFEPEGAAAPVDAEELAGLSQVLAELTGDTRHEDRKLLLSLFEGFSDLSLRRALIRPLVRVVQDQPDLEVAAALRELLALASDDATLRQEILQGLASVAEEPTLVTILPLCRQASEPDAEVRRFAVIAVASIADRIDGSDQIGQVVEVLVSLLLRDASGERNEPSDAVVGEAARNLRRAQLLDKLDDARREHVFRAARDALQAELDNDKLVLPLGRLLCIIKGKEPAAVQELAKLLEQRAKLLEQSPEAGSDVPNILLNRLVELVEVESMSVEALEPGLTQLASWLPRGGRTIEPAAGAEEAAVGALSRTSRRFEKDPKLVGVKERLASVYRREGRPFWAADLLSDVIERVREAGDQERLLRLTWKRAETLLDVVVRDTFDGRQRKNAATDAWGLLERLVAEAELPAAVPKLGVLRGLVSCALLVPGTGSGADYGRELLKLLPANADRSGWVLSTAQLHQRAGEWADAYELLKEELPEATTPEVCILRARVSRRSPDGPADPNDRAAAIREYERLLVTSGPALLPQEHADRPKLELELADLYIAAGSFDKAVALVDGVAARLPPNGPSLLREDIEDLRAKLEDRGGGERPPGSSP